MRLIRNTIPPTIRNFSSVVGRCRPPASSPISAITPVSPALVTSGGSVVVDIVSLHYMRAPYGCGAAYLHLQNDARGPKVLLQLAGWVRRHGRLIHMRSKPRRSSVIVGAILR